MRSGIGGAFLGLALLLAGMGLAIGLLLTQSTGPDQAQASAARYAAIERLQAQARFEEQQHIQALKNQSAAGDATAAMIRTGGPVIAYSIAVAILLMSASWSYRQIYDQPRHIVQRKIRV